MEVLVRLIKVKKSNIVDQKANSGGKKVTFYSMEFPDERHLKYRNKVYSCVI